MWVSLVTWLTTALVRSLPSPQARQAVARAYVGLTTREAHPDYEARVKYIAVLLEHPEQLS